MTAHRKRSCSVSSRMSRFTLLLTQRCYHHLVWITAQMHHLDPPECDWPIAASNNSRSSISSTRLSSCFSTRSAPRIAPGFDVTAETRSPDASPDTWSGRGSRHFWTYDSPPVNPGAESAEGDTVLDHREGFRYFVEGEVETVVVEEEPRVSRARPSSANARSYNTVTTRSAGEHRRLKWRTMSNGEKNARMSLP
jgi:hypothetical protein